MPAYADPYEFDARPVVSLVLASGSIQGRLAEIDHQSFTIETRDGFPKKVPAAAVEGLFRLAFPDPKIWGRNRPAGPNGRHVIHGAEG